MTIAVSNAIMATLLERIRTKITELEARLAGLRIAERELVALEPAPARKSKLRPKRKRKGTPPARSTIGSAIAEVLHEHGALPASEIAEQIKVRGREIESRSVSFALQALKKQGRVRIRGGKWSLRKARSRPAAA